MSKDLGYWFQQTLNIVQLLSFYAPLALAFALVQGVTRRLFLSFGDVAMYASFAAIYTCYDALVRGDGDVIGVSLGLLAAVSCAASFGYLLAKWFFGSKLLHHGQAFMIASIGLSIALQEIMRLQSLSRDIWIPPLFQEMFLFDVPGDFRVKLAAMTGLAIFVSAAVILLFLAALRFSRFGANWRAICESPQLAKLCGVNTELVMALTFAMASGMAGVSGWIAALSYGGTNFTIGLMMGFKAMFASVIGGFGTVRGALVGALAIATIEVVWSAIFSTTYRDVAVFVLITFALLLRPEGLVGIHAKRESEALV